NGERPESGTVDGDNLAAGVHRVQSALKRDARLRVGAAIAVAAVGRDENAGPGIGRRNPEQAGEPGADDGGKAGGRYGSTHCRPPGWKMKRHPEPGCAVEI